MKYRKKPVVIEAYQLTEEMVEELLFDKKELSGIRMTSASLHPPTRTIYSYTLRIDTLEGETYKVDVGDWIIRGVKGEYYPCKPDIFEATYEFVDVKKDSIEADKIENVQPNAIIKKRCNCDREENKQCKNCGGWY